MKGFDTIADGVWRLRSDNPFRHDPVRLPDGRFLWPEGLITAHPPIRGGDIIEGARIAGDLRRSPDAQYFVVAPGAGALQAAIDACVDDNGDAIICLEGSHSVTAKVDINKDGITIAAADLGLFADSQGEKFTVNAAAALDDDYAAEITDPCRIVGMGFAGRDLTKASLHVNAEEAGGFAGGFLSLEHCRFSAWYGAIDYGLLISGGQQLLVKGCTFDGLFAGFDVAAIGVQVSGLIDPGGHRYHENSFEGVGSGKHAIKHIDKSLNFDYWRNVLMPGFLGNYGKMLDNDSKASTGICRENYVAPNANQAAAFENLTNATIGFAGNVYEEA